MEKGLFSKMISLFYKLLTQDPRILCKNDQLRNDLESKIVSKKREKVCENNAEDSRGVGEMELPHSQRSSRALPTFQFLLPFRMPVMRAVKCPDGAK